MKGVLAQKWTVDLQEEIVAAPTVINPSDPDRSRILIGTKQGKLHVLNSSGEVQWTYNSQDSLSSEEQLFVDSDEVYSINTEPKVLTNPKTKETLVIIGTQEGKVHCIGKGGVRKWVVYTDGPIRAAPSTMFAGKTKELFLLIGSHDEHIYVISLEGKIVKKLHVTESIETTPLVVKQQLIVGTTKGTLIAVDITGKVTWTVQTKKRISANLVHTRSVGGEDIILAASEDSNLYAISAEGEVLWRTPTRGAIIAKPAILQTNPTTKEVLFGSTDNSLYCLDLEDGDELWSYETNFWVGCTPAIEKGKEYTYAIVGSYDANVYVLDAMGSYELDIIPGLGGVVNQGTFRISSMGSDAGEDKGKLLSRFHVHDFVIGSVFAAQDAVVAVTKKGKVYNLKLS